jgi:membrane fusion protein, copper/silver efflux system
MNRSVKIFIAVALLFSAVFCGYLYGRKPSGASVSTGKQAQKSEYTCPMHPFILKDTPGACPICAMELVRKVEGLNLDQDLKGKQHVALSPAQQIMANLATVTAAAKPMVRNIDCTGIVAFNQEKQGKVSAWVAGRVDLLSAKSVGSRVNKLVPVAELFSADLYNAQVQYLLAYRTIKILNNTATVPFPINTQMALGESHEKLRQLGFKDEQFSKLQKSNKPSVSIPLYSPISGVVTESFVREGQYVNVGEPLFTIADLSRVWVELELFESDLPLVKVGQNVTISSRSYPELSVSGKVNLIYPFLDSKTRTAKLRVEIPNPGLTLKPEMYVLGSINVSLADSIVIPVASVMDTGKRQIVWVEAGPGVFQPRDVKTGIRSGAEIQILSGLKAGEKVAVTGGYLIDSEAQLSRTATEPVSPAPAVKPEKPSVKPGKKDEMDMKDMKMN